MSNAALHLQLTRITAVKPARLSKRFSLVGSTLVKESGGNLTDGIAERLSIASLAEFAALLPTLKPNQALVYGITGHDCARVIAKDATPPGDNDLPVINRTRDHFHWPEGAGLLMLDYDPAPDSAPLDMNALHGAVTAACPALADAPAIWRPSASSCIYAKDSTELRGMGGQRLYVPVREAADIPRAGDVLFKRLWLAGLGRYEVSKSGALLARSTVDASVFQPERLDFAGGADCGRGLEQRLPEPVLINADAPYLDSRSALPDLTAEEEERLAGIRNDLAATLEPERQRVRENWIAERVAAGLAKLPEARREVDRPRLEATYRQAAEGGRLGLDFELVIVKKGTRTRKVMTVFEVLNQRDAYHEATACDPLEPDYPDGQARLVGWLNLRAPEPYLQSQAHGGTRYTLGMEPQPRPVPVTENLPADTGAAAVGEPSDAGPAHPDYVASPAGTFWVKHCVDGDHPVFLANFRAEIQRETTIDDGAITVHRLEIAGRVQSGEYLPLVQVASGQFASLNWVGEQWGTAAQIAPGQGKKDHLRYAIQVLSQNITRRSVYGHVGWRKIGDDWVYLSAGACIGAEGMVPGVDVELSGSLADYSLESGGDPRAALAASLGVLDCAPLPISAALLLAPYLAILSEALPTDFSLFLAGTTGTRKTELAAIVQAHFGAHWHGKHLPGSWSSTANRLEQDAFHAKDAVLVIDDFCPTGSTQDMARLHREADRLLRGAGNRSGRARMNADGSPRPTYYPRGLILSTGEDVPRGQSLRGRMLVLEFAPDTVNLDALTAMQAAASDGRLAQAAAAFAHWLAPQMDDLKARLPARVREQRTALLGAGAHTRHPDTLAGLIVTAELWAQFATDKGVILPADWLATITTALLQTGQDQAQFIATEEPASRFIRLIHAGLAAGLCHVKRKDGREPVSADAMSALGWQLKTFGVGEHERTDWHAQGSSIGWFDDNDLFLDPEASYRAAAQFADAQGQALPLTQQRLFKALVEKGLIRSRSPGRTSMVIKVGGETHRVLHIPRVYPSKSGNFGNFGNQGQQLADMPEENTVTDFADTASLAVTSVTGDGCGYRFSPPVTDWVTDSSVDRLPSDDHNTLVTNDISDTVTKVTKVTKVTAFPHRPPLQVSTSSLATRIFSTLQAAGPGGLMRTDLDRIIGNARDASPVLIELALMRLVKEGAVGRVNSRFVAHGEAL